MNLLATVRRIFLIWATLFVARTVAGAILPFQAPAPENMLPWFLAAYFLIAVAIAVLVTRSNWQRWQNSVAACAILLAIELINMIEGIVFLNLHIWGRLLGQLVIFYAILAPLWMLILPKVKGETTTPAYGSLLVPSGRFWRFLLSDLAYLLFYFTAGTIIFPFVRNYYASLGLPSTAQIVSLQFLVRGPLFIGVCLLLTRMLRMTGALGWLTTGAVFAVVSGIALIIPNPYFPDSVRWVHFWEVSSSNFLFAVFVSWLWTVPRPKALPAAQAA